MTVYWPKTRWYLNTTVGNFRHAIPCNTRKWDKGKRIWSITWSIFWPHGNCLFISCHAKEVDTSWDILRWCLSGYSDGAKVILRIDELRNVPLHMSILNVYRSTLYTRLPSISIFRLRGCLCLILWGWRIWHYRAWIYHRIKYEIMYVLAWRTVYVLTRVLFWCLSPGLRSNQGNKHQNNTRVSAWTVCHKSTYIILYFTRHNESINDVENQDLHNWSPCLTCSVYVLLMTSQSIGDDVSMSRQLWREPVASDI